MTEPTGAIAAATGAGVGAMILATLGVEPQALMWGGVGATFGVTLAPPASRMRTALTFCAVVMMAAMFGKWGAHVWWSGSDVARNGMAMVSGLFFHPAFSVAVNLLPRIGEALIARFGGKQGGQS